MHHGNSTRHKMGTAGCLLAAGAVLIAGCGSDATDTSAGDRPAGPDVSKTGRMDYACALARDLPADGSVFDTSDAAASREFAGATRLLGTMTGSHIPGYEPLSDDAFDAVNSMTRINPGGVDDAVTALTDDCADNGLPREQPDVSQTGQIDYACALTETARAGDYPLDSLTTGEQANPTVTAAAAASGLLIGTSGRVGATAPSSAVEDSTLSEPASHLYWGISNAHMEAINNSIDTLATACAQRG